MNYPDETDLTLEDLKVMWQEAEPVEIVDGPVTVNDSPWLQRVHTASSTGRAWVERKTPSLFGLRPTGAASS